MLRNYVNGAWTVSGASDAAEVVNPATGEVLARAPMSTAAEVNAAARAAVVAAVDWARTPATDRIQYLFKLKAALEANLDDICRICTNECGKTYAESRGEMQRALENIEVACGIPLLMQGHTSEDIARGIDEYMFRQPLGVAAAITPFNFPGMIAFWFLPYALATGNCFIVKPSEKTPMTTQRIFELIDSIGFPPGVVQLINGGHEAVNALLDHPAIGAISFVGATQTAQYIYGRAAANGKRAQCQGGAKNPVVIMPDADMDTAVRIIADAAFGCAGQRCLALSQAITVGDARDAFLERIVAVAKTRRVGYGLDPDTEMGPVIRAESRERIAGLTAQAVADGATVLAGGSPVRVPGHNGGYFFAPTVLDGLPAASPVAQTEIFGPVLTLAHAADLDDALEMVNARAYGNMACIFTGSGASARRFRQEAVAGNIGVNIGVAAPMAFFPFSGWKQSFFGDLHGQARHAVEFFTQTKVVVERWPKDWTRRF